MAKKERSEKNKRYSYIGTGAKYTIILNGDELNIIAGALSALISNSEKAMNLNPREYRKIQGHEKEELRLKNTIEKSKKLLNDLDIESLKGYFIK